MTLPLVVVDTSIHLASEVYTKADSPSREVIARGFAESGPLLDEARDEAARTLANCLGEDISELKLLQEHIHDAVGTLIRERTGRRPMILPVVLEV